MPNYANGKIYKLTSKKTDKIYIGSTVNSLTRRILGHIHASNKCSSNELINNYDDIEIELIEEFPCENREQLETRESYWIGKYHQTCINKLHKSNEVVKGTKLLMYQNNDMFLILNKETKSYECIKKNTPNEKPPQDVFEVSITGQLSAFKQYLYDLERKKKKYHTAKEQRIKTYQEQWNEV